MKNQKSSELIAKQAELKQLRKTRRRAYGNAVKVKSAALMSAASAYEAAPTSPVLSIVAGAVGSTALFLAGIKSKEAWGLSEAVRDKKAEVKAQRQLDAAKDKRVVQLWGDVIRERDDRTARQRAGQQRPEEQAQSDTASPESQATPRLENPHANGAQNQPTPAIPETSIPTQTTGHAPNTFPPSNVVQHDPTQYWSQPPRTHPHQ